MKNVFEEGELNEKAVVRNFRTTASDGKSYDINYYNLDVVIFVGYRVKSIQGTQFRIWATTRLNEYIRKGFAMESPTLSGRLVGLLISQTVNLNLKTPLFLT